MILVKKLFDFRKEFKLLSTCISDFNLFSRKWCSFWRLHYRYDQIGKICFCSPFWRSFHSNDRRIRNWSKQTCRCCFYFVTVSTSKDGDLSSYFDKINENKINNTTLKEIIVDNHTIQSNKGKIFGHLSKNYIFAFCKTYNKVTKN